ncbi:MAG: iron-sulfur cluster assembly scaffold protein [Candidatus Magnetomorum sp.]|nr:iron-sulfur cluster assembly scaffold protein [Candidatus Magnetomorum sp.]
MLSFLVGFLLITTIIGGWVWAHYRLNPYIDHPDAKARITGRCGDTMEIQLTFDHNGRVNDTSHWTNGCGYSLTCVAAATDLSIGKTPEEILDIRADLIQNSIGGLSKDHMHCATLAEETLHAAIDSLMASQWNKNEPCFCKKKSESNPNSRS